MSGLNPVGGLGLVPLAFAAPAGGGNLAPLNPWLEILSATDSYDKRIFYSDEVTIDNAASGRRALFIIDPSVTDAGRNDPPIVSEAMGFAMLQAIQRNDARTFDMLLVGVEAMMTDGLPCWGGDLTKNADGSYSFNARNDQEYASSTDADQDIAFALLQAYEKAKQGVRGFSGKEAYYAEKAQKFLNLIWESSVYNSDITIIGVSEDWGTGYGGRIHNPSYISAGMLEAFSTFDTNPMHQWGQLRDDTLRLREFIAAGRGYESFPDFISVGYNGKEFVTQKVEGKSNGFGLEAIRTFWRIATDVLWLQDPVRRAKSIKLARKIMNQYLLPDGSLDMNKIKAVGLCDRNGYGHYANKEVVVAVFAVLAFAAAQNPVLGGIEIGNYNDAYLQLESEFQSYYLASEGYFSNRTDPKIGQRYYDQYLMQMCAQILAGRSDRVYTQRFTVDPIRGIQYQAIRSQHFSGKWFHLEYLDFDTPYEFAEQQIVKKMEYVEAEPIDSDRGLQVRLGLAGDLQAMNFYPEAANQYRVVIENASYPEYAELLRKAYLGYKGAADRAGISSKDRIEVFEAMSQRETGNPYAKLLLADACFYTGKADNINRAMQLCGKILQVQYEDPELNAEAMKLILQKYLQEISGIDLRGFDAAGLEGLEIALGIASLVLGESVDASAQAKIKALFEIEVEPLRQIQVDLKGELRAVCYKLRADLLVKKGKLQSQETLAAALEEYRLAIVQDDVSADVALGGVLGTTNALKERSVEVFPDDPMQGAMYTKLALAMHTYLLCSIDNSSSTTVETAKATYLGTSRSDRLAALDALQYMLRTAAPFLGIADVQVWCDGWLEALDETAELLRAAAAEDQSLARTKIWIASMWIERELGKVKWETSREEARAEKALNKVGQYFDQICAQAYAGRIRPHFEKASYFLRKHQQAAAQEEVKSILKLRDILAEAMVTLEAGQAVDLSPKMISEDMEWALVDLFYFMHEIYEGNQTGTLSKEERSRVKEKLSEVRAYASDSDTDQEAMAALERALNQDQPSSIIAIAERHINLKRSLEYYQDKMQPAFLPELRRRVQILSRAEELLDDKGELIKEAESKCASIVLSCERSLKEKGYDADWFVLYLDANYALAWAMAGTGKLYEDQILLEEMLDVSSSEASDPRVAEALRILRDKENIGYLRELFVARPYLKAKAQKMLGDIYLIQGYSVADFDDQGKYFQEALEMYNGAKAVNPFDSELDERIRKAEEAIKAHKQHGISISGVQELINAFGRNQ